MEGFHLNQQRYILQLLERAQLIDVKVVTTPFEARKTLPKTLGEPLANPCQYRKILGALQYCTLKKPKMAYSVNKLSHFLHCPAKMHWALTK